MSYSINVYFHCPEYVFLLLHFFPPHFKSISYNQYLLVFWFVFFFFKRISFHEGVNSISRSLLSYALGWMNLFYALGFGRPGIQSFRSYTLSPLGNHLTSFNPSILICKIGIKPSTKFLVVLKWDNIQEIPLETKWYYTTVNCYCHCRFTSLSESLARYLVFWR